MPKPRTRSQSQIFPLVWWLVLAATLVVVLWVRLRFLSYPLERDEGEYAYAGQLLLQGVPPYKLAYNMKFPGTYAAYAGIMSLFGQTTVGIHFGFLLVNIATIGLILLLGRRLLNTTAGIAAAATYALLSLSPATAGFSAHATHFVVLPALAGCVVLVSFGEKRGTRPAFTAGLLFGTGLLMKQPALAFVVFGAGALVYFQLERGWNWRAAWRELGAYLAGSILPIALTALLLWRDGVFGRFFFWTIHYASAYGGLVTMSQGMVNFQRQIRLVTQPDLMCWLLALLGIGTSLWNASARRAIGFSLSFLLASALALSMGLYFREHYFVLVLPAIALLAGIAVASVENLLIRKVYQLRPLLPALLLLILFFPIWSYRQLFFSWPPEMINHEVYYPNPFVEAAAIGNYLRTHTSPDDTVAVLGSEPEIYFYAQRHSATGYIYTYGLMEPQKDANQMQQEMMKEIESAHPKYLVVVMVPTSWLSRPDSNKGIFRWAESYCAANYLPVGAVKLARDGGETDFSGVPNPATLGRNYVLIYKRKT